MENVEFSTGARSGRDFPAHWGEAPPAREEARRVSWILENIAADDATGIPQAVRARRILREQGATLPPRLYAALVALRDQGTIGA